MTRELPLFAQAGRGRSSPAKSAGTEDTRSEAAAAIASHATGMRRAVLDFIRAAGEHGATDEEVSSRLRLKLDSSRARRVELRDMGLITDSGRRRKTQSGRAAVVWVAARAPAAMPAAEISTASEQRAESATWAETMIRRLEAGLCPTCGRARWWRSVYGGVICGDCHPPAAPGLVAEWIGG